MVPVWRQLVSVWCVNVVIIQPIIHRGDDWLDYFNHSPCVIFRGNADNCTTFRIVTGSGIQLSVMEINYQM